MRNHEENPRDEVIYLLHHLLGEKRPTSDENLIRLARLWRDMTSRATGTGTKPTTVVRYITATQGFTADIPWHPAPQPEDAVDKEWWRVAVTHANMLVDPSCADDQRLIAFVTLKGALEHLEQELPRGPLQDGVIVVLDAIRKNRLENLSEEQLRMIVGCVQRLVQEPVDTRTVEDIDRDLLDVGLDWVMGE